MNYFGAKHRTLRAKLPVRVDERGNWVIDINKINVSQRTKANNAQPQTDNNIIPDSDTNLNPNVKNKKFRV